MSHLLTSVYIATPVPSNYDYPISVSSDACVKAYHFSNAGVKQAENLPLTSSKDSYIGETNGQVERMAEANVLQSTAMDAVRFERETMAAALAEDPCNVTLVAARHTAAAKGDLDRTGLAGLCCKHVFPLKDLFVFMVTPEQYNYYVVLFKNLLLRKPSVRVLALDVGCRFKKRWDSMIEDGIANGSFAEQLKDIALVVPYMHGSKHGSECQLQFCAVYRVSM